MLDTLRQRQAEIRTGRQSGIVTGLVVEGGGMRGLYSIGALAVLQECGLTGAFDHIFAASTGALNASCFLAEQCGDALAAYLNDVTNRRFVNYLRWRKIVDVDFLVDEIMTRRRGLRVDKVLQSPSRLHVVLTDAVSRRAHVVTNQDPMGEWKEVLRATMALPFLYNRPVALAGRTYMDGCVVEPVPFTRAFQAGCTDILVILSRQPDFRTTPGFLRDLLERPLLRKYPAGIRELVRADRAAFNATMELLEHPQRLNHGVRLRVIYPSDMRRMGGATTLRRERLLACAAMADRDTRRFLGLDARR